MRGSEFLASLPEEFTPAREQAILDAVRGGNYVLNWVPITVYRPPYRATIWVSNDALRIGQPDDSVRVAVMAQTEQMIADELNATLPTALLSDEIYRQADIKLMPVTLGSERRPGESSKNPMSTTSRMKLHHDLVEEQLSKWYNVPLSKAWEEILVAPVGKDWVASRRLLGEPRLAGAPAAINYGWHRQDMSPAAHVGPFPSVSAYPPVVVHQSEGMAHNMLHQDYSQVVRLVARAMLICMPKEVAAANWPWVSSAPSVSGLGAVSDACESGVACTLENGETGVSMCMDIYDVAEDERLSPLVNHNGVVYMRQPGVPYQSPVGQHSIWGGLTPSAPPASKLWVPSVGEVAPDHLVPDPGDVAVPGGPPPAVASTGGGMAGKLVGFGVGAVVGWSVAAALSRSLRGAGR